MSNITEKKELLYKDLPVEIALHHITRNGNLSLEEKVHKLMKIISELQAYELDRKSKKATKPKPPVLGRLAPPESTFKQSVEEAEKLLDSLFNIVGELDLAEEEASVESKVKDDTLEGVVEVETGNLCVKQHRKKGIVVDYVGDASCQKCMLFVDFGKDKKSVYCKAGNKVVPE